MQINKQDEKLFQELLKKYKQGLISGLIQGNNVTLTSTGCRNKVISSTGGGGDFDLYEEATNYPLADPNTLTGDEVFFIAGAEGSTLTLSTLVAIIEENVLRSGFYEKEQVNVSRAFQPSDKNKILMLNTGVMLSIPVGEVFSNGDILAVTYAIDNQDPTTGFNTTLGGHLIVPFVTMDGIPNEIVYLSALNVDGQTTLLPISTFIKPDASDEQVKTGLRYLMDNNSGTQFIPLSGTEVGNPVTGDIEFEFDSFKGVVYKDENVNYGFVIADTPIMYYDGTSMGHNKIQLRTTENGFVVSKESGVNAFVGFTALEDLSANITDLDYTQKIYVDTKLSRQVFNINTSTTADNISNIDYVYNISGGSTLTLPTAVGNTNEYKINNVDTIPCDIVADGVETIDGLSLFTLISQYDSITLISDGASWVAGGGGSSSFSGLTSATGTNTIDNANYVSEWQWNSQTNAPMLKLSSTSTGALTGGNGLEINLSGTLVNSQTTYAAKFINTRGSGFGSNIGAYFQGAPAIQTSGGIDIGGNNYLRWNNGSFDGSYITSKYNTPQFYFNAIGSFNFRSTHLLGSIFSTVDNRPEIVLGLQSATRSSISFGGDNINANGTQYRSESVTSCIIERNLGKLLFSTNVGLAGGYANFTPTYQMCVDGTNNNVAIGKGNTAGDASAKLEVVSTTQGFLPPRMTATQASAIVSPAQGLMLFVTDTNGTFTGVGWWGYNGANWEKLNN